MKMGGESETETTNIFHEKTYTKELTISLLKDVTN